MCFQLTDFGKIPQIFPTLKFTLFPHPGKPNFHQISYPQNKISTKFPTPKIPVGRVTSVKPERTIKVEHQVYNSTTVNVPVHNTTSNDGLFNVKIVEAILNHPLPYPMEMITQPNQARARH